MNLRFVNTLNALLDKGSSKEALSLLATIKNKDVINGWQYKAYKAKALYQLDRTSSEALDIYKDIYESNNKDIAAVTGYAVSLQSVGKLSEAIEVIKNAMSFNKDDKRLISLLIELYKDKSEYSLIMDLYNKRNECLDIEITAVNLLVVSFLLGRLDFCRELMIELASRFSNLTDNSTAYFSLLNKICAFRLPEKLIKLDEASFVAIGESHAVGLNGIDFVENGKRARIKSLWVEGAKQYHLSLEANNVWKSAFKSCIKKTKSSDTIIVAIGEIDIRFNEGVFYAWYKNQTQSLEGMINQTVVGFLDFVERHIDKEKLIIWGVPAPRENKYDYEVGSVDEKKFLAGFQLFVRKSKEICARRGIRYVDVYSFTVGDNGYGRPYLYLDDTHIHPYATKLILQNYFSSLQEENTGPNLALVAIDKGFLKIDETTSKIINDPDLVVMHDWSLFNPLMDQLPFDDFDDLSLDLLVLPNFLEHLPLNKVIDTLKLVLTKIKDNGFLIVKFVDLEKIATLILRGQVLNVAADEGFGQITALDYLHGIRSHNQFFGTLKPRYSSFTTQVMKNTLNQAGFDVISEGLEEKNTLQTIFLAKKKSH